MPAMLFQAIKHFDSIRRIIMKKSLFLLFFVMLAMTAMDIQARGGGQGGGHGGMHSQGIRQRQAVGSMEHESIRQRQLHQESGKFQGDGQQMQQREMNQEQNQIHQTAPITNAVPAQ
jgi:hypothetical protein